MKNANKLKKVLIFAFLIGTMVGLIGCGETSQYEGIWETKSIAVDGVDKTEIYDNELDVELELITEEQADETVGGIGTLTIIGLPGNISWVEVEGGLEVTDEMGLKVNFVAEGENTLSFSYNGIEYTLSKVAE